MWDERSVFMVLMPVYQNATSEYRRLGLFWLSFPKAKAEAQKFIDACVLRSEVCII